MNKKFILKLNIIGCSLVPVFNFLLIFLAYIQVSLGNSHFALSCFLFFILMGLFWQSELRSILKKRKQILKYIRKRVKAKKKHAYHLNEKLRLLELEKRNFIKAKHLALRARCQQDFFILMQNLIERKTDIVVKKEQSVPIFSQIKPELKCSPTHEFFKLVLVSSTQKYRLVKGCPPLIEFIFPTDYLSLN